MIVLVVPFLPTMNTLTEIEAAAEALPTEQQEELLTFLAARIGRRNELDSHAAIGASVLRVGRRLAVEWHAQSLRWAWGFRLKTTPISKRPAQEHVLRIRTSISGGGGLSRESSDGSLTTSATPVIPARVLILRSAQSETLERSHVSPELGSVPLSPGTLARSATFHRGPREVSNGASGPLPLQ